MGISGISPMSLIIILAIILLLFGTKKLSSLGTDLGSAIKGFRKAIGGSSEADKTELKKDSEEPEKQA